MIRKIWLELNEKGIQICKAYFVKLHTHWFLLGIPKNAKWAIYPLIWKGKLNTKPNDIDCMRKITVADHFVRAHHQIIIDIQKMLVYPRELHAKA